MEPSRMIFKAPAKKEDLHHCKVKRTHRSQPYDRSPPNVSRSSTGTPPSSPDQSINGDETVVKEQKRHRREEANKRERTRMHTVNSAFDHLRQLVPTYPSNRKLSKIETLRLACSYIQDLTKLVNENNIRAMHGEDVNIMYRCSELTKSETGGYGPATHYPNTTSTAATVPGYINQQKNDYTNPPEFNTQNYCYQPYVNSDADSCQSETDVPSPTHGHHYTGLYNLAPSQQSVSNTTNGIHHPPPSAAATGGPITRVSSDTIIAMQMANTSIGSNSPTYCSSPVAAGAPCSPLTRAHQLSSSGSITHTGHVAAATLQCNPTPAISPFQTFSGIHTSPALYPQCYSQ